MPTFRYQAISAKGEATQGVMEASDEASVVAALRHSGSLPVSIGAAKAGATGLLPGLGLRRGAVLRRAEMTAFTRELAMMLGAGQDLDHALRFLVETAPNGRVRRITAELRDAVRGGAALATALSAQGTSFAPLYVGLVRAGEAGGSLAITLERLATLLERERALMASVTSAMVYPALLLVAACGAIALLLTQVLPQFVPLFRQNGASLPRSTELLLAAGEFVGAWWMWGLLLLVLVLLTLRQALQRPAVRLLADRLLLRLPVAGGLAREAMAARMTRTLGTLVQNGVALVPALGITRDALGNLAGVAALDRATLGAKGGAGLAASLEATATFPPRTIHLLRLGEETAQLGPMALRAAEIHEAQVQQGLQRLVTLLTPAITIIMGAAVAGIVASLLTAMLSLNDLAQ